MPSTVSYTPSQQPAPASPRAINSSIPAPVSAFIQEPENPYENDTFDLPELSVYRSSDTWITDEDEDDYYEMVQDTAQYIAEKNASETEHIKLINYDSRDVFTHTTLMAHIVESLKEISELFGISTSDASTLLK